MKRKNLKRTIKNKILRHTETETTPKISPKMCRLLITVQQHFTVIRKSHEPEGVDGTQHYNFTGSEYKIKLQEGVN